MCYTGKKIQGRAIMKITQNSPQQKEPFIPQTPPVSEREKLKAMTPRDRAWYIWEYYKFPIIGVFVALVVAWNIGAAIYRGTYDTAFYCVYLNNRSDMELNTAPLEQGFSQYLGLGEKELITTESSFISYGDSATELSYASMAKLTALISAKELDVIIGDMENLEHYGSMDGFLDLEATLPEDLLPLVQEHLVYVKGSDGVSRAYGVSLSGTAFADESHLAQQPPVLGIISNSKHKDRSVALLRYIFAP